MAENGITSNRKKIEAALEKYVEFWNKSDMDSWGTLFTEDVDYINRNGGWWRNNADNITGHKKIHQMLIEMRQPKTFSLEIKKIEFLNPDIAIVQAVSEWPGLKPFTAEKPVENMKGIITCVFVNSDGNWLIKTLHNTLRVD